MKLHTCKSILLKGILFLLSFSMFLVKFKLSGPFWQFFGIFLKKIIIFTDIKFKPNKCKLIKILILPFFWYFSNFQNYMKNYKVCVEKYRENSQFVWVGVE